MPVASSDLADATPLVADRTFHVRTGATHVFRLPAPRMTIVFLIDSSSRITAEFPKYVLQSTDGSYAQEKSARDDLVPGDAYLQLVFEELIPGKRYTLTRFDDTSVFEVVFEALPFAEVVDQPRPMHGDLIAHGYGEFDLVEEDGPLFEDWTSDDGESAV